MASRNLTEVFVLMRNNAIRNRHLYADQETSEHMALVELYDVEQGITPSNRMPPAWIDQLDEAQFALSKLEHKLNDLDKLHSQHLHRPTFDENSEEEVLIESCTAEITTLFNSIHRILQFIKSHTLEGTSKERQLTTNVVRSLATSLQDMSIKFRGSQNNYIKQLKSREERSKMYFDNAVNNDYDVFSNQNESIDDFFVNSSKQMTQQQLLYLEEENIQVAQQREQEINAIVRSIVELNEIFKDLSQMVMDQGSILDRIDYNIEQTHTQVYEGFKQLQKADAYQRKNRKMWAIIVLAATTIVLFFILIIVKS